MPVWITRTGSPRDRIQRNTINWIVIDTAPYVTHFIFRPLQSIDILELGTATVLEAVGTTENLKGEKMLDTMAARCTALSVDFGA